MDALTGAKSSPLNQRLKVLDQEIRKLYRSCKDAGYEPEKIREVALPVIHAARRGVWKRRAKHSLIAVGILCVFASLFMWSPTNYAFRVATKKVMVKLLPYYDWTWPYLADCMMLNPYYVEESSELTEQDCEFCRDFKQLEPQVNVTVEDITNQIFDMLPTLVDDAMGDWRATKESLNYESFLKLHHSKPFMENPENYCFERVSGGLDMDNITVPRLLERVEMRNESGAKPNFTANWQNCKVDTFKEIHKLYYKPYFIPAMCEPIQHKNYILLGRKSEVKSRAQFFAPKNMELGVWFGQLFGSMEMLFQPKTVCKKLCPVVKFNLTAGQIVNVPTTIYNIAFRPSSYEAAAIGVGYLYN